MFVYAVLAFFLQLLNNLAGSILNFQIPQFQWDWTADFFAVMNVVFFIVPVYDLFPLISLIVLIGIIRICIAFLKFLFDAIPTY